MSRRAVPSQGRHARWWLLALALLVAALAVFAAGCGGDDDDEAGGTDTAASTDEGTETGAAEGSIWVLLPDSTSSDRWEKDDRRFFEAAFDDAGVELQHRQRRGRREHPAAAGGAGADAGAKVILLTNLTPSSGATIIETAREARRARWSTTTGSTAAAPARRLRQLRQRARRPTMADTVGRLIDELDADPKQVVMMNGGADGQQLEALQAGLQRDGRLRRLEEGRRRRVGARRRPGRARLGQPAGADHLRADPRRQTTTTSTRSSRRTTASPTP